MRFLKRHAATKPSVAPLRRRPFPTFAVVLGLSVAAFGAGGGGSYWLWHDGTVAGVAHALVARGLALAGREGLNLENVEVVGRQRQSVASILAALDVRRGMPIFDIDLRAAKARLEALPWIRSADVERRLPNTLFVRLTEREPFAFWQRGDTLSLVDRDGTVIPVASLAPYGPRIVLVGDDAPQQAAILLEMLASAPALARRVNAAVRYGDRRWTLRFDTGVEVALPESDAPAAWRRLAALEAQQHILERAIVAVDLRLPDRTVVRLAPAAGNRPAARAGGKDRSS